MSPIKIRSKPRSNMFKMYESVFSAVNSDSLFDLSSGVELREAQGGSAP